MSEPPPVAPVEGHYALLRNGEIRGPLKRCSWPTGDYFICPADNVSWELDGTNDNASDYDIIATISPTDMQAVASGELERLRAALTKIEDMEYINQLSGNVNFERAQKIARTTLQGDAP